MVASVGARLWESSTRRANGLHCGEQAVAIRRLRRLSDVRPPATTDSIARCTADRAQWPDPPCGLSRARAEALRTVHKHLRSHKPSATGE
eukprot:scaffold38721_cov42-Phaeocystis_antarctica.AAC.1